MSHKPRDKPPRAGQEKHPGKPFKISGTTLLLGGIMLLGLVVRLLPAIYSIVGDKVVFLGPDSYYHMRRIVMTVLHYPAANTFDPYVNYPHGFTINWPPLFDVITATASLLAGFGHPDAFTIEVVASVVPYHTSSSLFVRTDDFYSITCGSLSTSVAVPESAVLGGATIQAS